MIKRGHDPEGKGCRLIIFVSYLKTLEGASLSNCSSSTLSNSSSPLSLHFRHHQARGMPSPRTAAAKARKSISSSFMDEVIFHSPFLFLSLSLHCQIPCCTLIVPLLQYCKHASGVNGAQNDKFKPSHKERAICKVEI